MWDFFKYNLPEIVFPCGFINFIIGFCALLETVTVGWHFWSLFFTVSLVVTVFYCTGVVCYYMYKSYVFNKRFQTIPVQLFSIFILGITLVNILVVFYALSGILFSVVTALLIIIGSTVVFAVWHKQQLELKED